MFCRIIAGGIPQNGLSRSCIVSYSSIICTLFDLANSYQRSNFGRGYMPVLVLYSRTASARVRDCFAKVSSNRL